MDRLLLTILTGISVSTTVLLAEDLCRHYDDKNCVHPNSLKNGYYVNQWSVHLPGMNKAQARQLFEDNGFVYLGQVMDDVNLYLVTKLGTVEKHAMPNESVIESLKKLYNVHSVAQKHVLSYSEDSIYSVSEMGELECQTLDPETIRLNDGSENLRRIQAAQTANKANKPIASTQYRPTSSTNVSDDEVVEKYYDNGAISDEA